MNIYDIHRMIWDQYQDMNYDESDKKAMKILIGLGFTKDMLNNKTVKDLSGGWQMRVKLAKALFVEPDLMLLDEPTNHLDFPTVLWLQDYLNNKYSKTVIVVSHDRTFLNSVCKDGWTILLNQKKLTYYRGNFDTMIKTSKNQMVEQVKDYESIKRNVEEIKAWIAKYKDKGENMAQQVKSKRKILERLEVEMEELKPPHGGKVLKFEFPDVGGIDDYICKMEEVNFKYPNMKEMLLQEIDLQLGMYMYMSICCNMVYYCYCIFIDMDSRIGMIGPNGCGKTTLVKLIMQTLEPLSGECIVNRQCRIALFTQYHMDQLNLEQNAIQFLIDKFGQKDEALKKIKDKTQYVRGRLGRFKLTGTHHTKKMKYLSGGEKSRVAFCAATWKKPHFLIMDEPTNHLDIETIDSLIEAIKSFPGGVLVISHDQFFLKNIAKEYWSLSKDGIQTFEDFIDAKKFALKERLEQIGDEGIRDLDDDIDQNKKKFADAKKAKQQKIKDSKAKKDKSKQNELNKKKKKKKNK